MASAVTPTLGAEHVARPRPYTLAPSPWHSSEVQDVIKLLRALVVSLEWHVTAWLGGLQHRHHVQPVQVECPNMTVEVSSVFKLEVSQTILHQLVDNLVRNVLLEVLVIIVSAELVRNLPRLLVKFSCRELSRKEVSMSHVSDLRQVRVVDVRGSLATKVRVSQVLAEVVLGLAREPLEPVKTHVVRVGPHGAVEGKCAEIGLVRDDGGRHVEVV